MSDPNDHSNIIRIFTQDKPLQPMLMLELQGSLILQDTNTNNNKEAISLGTVEVDPNLPKRVTLKIGSQEVYGERHQRGKYPLVVLRRRAHTDPIPVEREKEPTNNNNNEEPQLISEWLADHPEALTLDYLYSETTSGRKRDREEDTTTEGEGRSNKRIKFVEEETEKSEEVKRIEQLYGEKKKEDLPVEDHTPTNSGDGMTYTDYDVVSIIEEYFLFNTKPVRVIQPR
ncbi:Ctf8, putative [Angomonas deanei]|uniref:Ctf8, putative n=1 Tax=Angomonas deanei TaxID=59799 RepID=A0A7G2CJL9_9TRYP|nr:Ctf8, putative [Angomonas deanei]